MTVNEIPILDWRLYVAALKDGGGPDKDGLPKDGGIVPLETVRVVYCQRCGIAQTASPDAKKAMCPNCGCTWNLSRPKRRLWGKR